MGEEWDQTTHMDKLTQTQDCIDALLTISSSTISYLTRKASFLPVSSRYPVTQTIPDAEDPAVFEESKKELVGDFLRKAKQLEFLIGTLPSEDQPGAAQSEEGEDEEELRALQREMVDVNKAYLDALAQAEEMHAQLKRTLRAALEARMLPTPSS